MMDALPYRSHTTGIATAELLLLDFMFDAMVPRQFFEDDAYRIHMNVPYGHGLTTSQVEATLSDLCHRGLVATGSGLRGLINHRMTAHGGDVWERERRPAWDAYVRDSNHTNDDGSEHLLLRASTPASAQRFLATAQRAGLHTLVPGTFAPCSVEGHDAQLIYWKTLPLVAFRASLVPEGESVRHADWEQYEAERSWWRNIKELQRWHQGAGG